MIQLYSMTVTEAAKVPPEICEKHFPLRYQRAQKFRFEEDRLRCLGAGYLLWKALGAEEEDLEISPGGKPHFKEAVELCSSGEDFDSEGLAGENLANGILSFCRKPEFSLSHSGEYILLAVGETPVGVDIEHLDPAHLSVAKRVFQPEELTWLENGTLPEKCSCTQEKPEEKTEKESEDQNTGRVERFFRLWTLKEAVMKALGRGLSLPPETFSVLPFLQEEPIVIEAQRLYGVSGMLPGYAIGLCSTGGKIAMPELQQVLWGPQDPKAFFPYFT